MKLHQIHRKQVIPISISEAWEFFSSPENLSTITPSWLNLTVISDLPRGMHSGMIISYRITPIVRVPTIWISEITHVNRPTYFVDEQRLGPFRFWHHQHMLKKSAVMSKFRISCIMPCLWAPSVKWCIRSRCEKKLTLFLIFAKKRWSGFYHRN